MGCNLICCSQRQETCGGVTRSDASASHCPLLTRGRRSQSSSYCTFANSMHPVLMWHNLRWGHLSTISPGVPMEEDLSGVGLHSLCRRQCGETRRALSSIRTRAPDSAAFLPKYASRSALAAAGSLSRCEETKGLHLHFRHLRSIPGETVKGPEIGVRNSVTSR